MRKKLPILRIIIFFAFLLLTQKIALADTSSGYAWSENTGYIDFSQVIVSSNELSGYAYSPNIGWISLNCSNTSSCGTVDYKVTNANGTLSGYAWSENTGFINFSQVNINTVTGVFSGYAYSPNIGWISLSCRNTNSCGSFIYEVATSWRPQQLTSGSGGIIYCTDNIYTFCRPLIQVVAPTKILPPVTPTKTVNLFTKTIIKTSPISEIKRLQQSLNIFIYSKSFNSLVVDGIYGKKLTLAIKLFQKENKLKQDGIFGDKTRDIINKLLMNN